MNPQNFVKYQKELEEKHKYLEVLNSKNDEKELEKLKNMRAKILDDKRIKLNGKIDDLSAMIVGAERYALGRRTYIVQWTCEFIKNNLHLITNKDKQVIIKDLENPISYGDECDKECWMQLLKILKMEVKENV